MTPSPDMPSIAILAGLGISWGGFLVWAMKILLQRYVGQIDARLAQMEAAIQARHTEWMGTERALLELKAQLPVEYVRKEDAIRQEVLIHAKLDGLAAKIDQMREAL